MAFIYDKTTRHAIDPDTGEEVWWGGGIIDSKFIFSYTYKYGDMKILLGITTHKRLVTHNDPKTGCKIESPMDCKFFVLEPTILGGLELYHRESGKPFPTPKEYKRIKQQICEGIFVHQTKRGVFNYLDFVPEFSVQIVRDLREIPPSDYLLP